jgi:hypothetical protein
VDRHSTAGGAGPGSADKVPVGRRLRGGAGGGPWVTGQSLPVSLSRLAKPALRHIGAAGTVVPGSAAKVEEHVGRTARVVEPQHVSGR